LFDDAIDGQARIVSFHLDGRRLPGIDRKRSWSERWGKRHILLTGISNLSELRELKISNVPVFELPEEMAQLGKLRHL
jgi:hypothetical protein